MKSRRTAKRTLDVVVSAAAFIVSAPIQGIVALLVLREFGRPVIFTQDRPGLYGHIFKLRKFRTMLPVDESIGRVSDADRLTRFGKFLRSTSLDELPTLLNVLRGDMSLVGPRPLLVKYLELYTPEQFRRHDVRPGITGLAQVRGRNSLSWEEKFSLDIEYVNNQSLALDFRIMLETIRAVLLRKGISAPTSPTMHEFEGSKEDQELLN
ncbi:sugar transferase [Arthrobacter bambusae]|uniref:Lipopolysaccharide/colanic/teichoic acid biosynthesis glycosyltransferase n=1 Tax=Arthrobacter bambusae TaxID=1338426 RepID=A0AAW8DGZ1_9MICC|nr:sugar transferase [Arthrobacter bambusae]MDP9904645.1 lipopolysaccharide/colanic/teichoic acid biosynthesis glycosyltransferase [Arthrobacter bambusae]MDQ0129461.1 lipopolysaccharide/colanic/teichoic acid biosynthesis glycosyltransferase [Arthrobacter bambusae]MDQ0180926.1 lipopolysaccharide/colanic/teichoic acid biosynthesis glycosyltransferase [Arthrobacter bambusae]